MLAGVLAATVAGACGGSGSEPPEDTATPADVRAAHVHGLGINPADDALLVATHGGLFRASPGEERAQRVGRSAQDTMGFTVVGPDRFLGSGHPDVAGLRDGQPPLLGLIESKDAGRRWRPVSLRGRADFHVLRTQGRRVYGFNASDGRLMVSEDGGRTWDARTPPGAVLDLAIRPGRADDIVVAAEDGLFESRDGGRGWRPLTRDRTGLLAWPAGGPLVLVAPTGTVQASTDAGVTWEPVGEVEGRPAALAWHRSDLYVALHTNEVKVSRDDGRTWQLRAALSG